MDRLEKQCMGFVRNAKGSDMEDRFVNKHNYILLLNEDHQCDSEVFLLVAALSAPENFEMRQAIRETYGTVKEYRRKSIRLVFFLGAELNESTNYLSPSIEKESKQYHDVIKGNFIDHYKNLTYKTVMALYWANNYCRTARYIIKVDDDVIVNIYKLVNFLVELEGNNLNMVGFLYCNLIRGAYPERSKSSKFSVSYEEYSYYFYPPYCAGPGYLFSKDVSYALYHTSQQVPFCQFEDVFIGFCANEAAISITDSYFGYFMDTYKTLFNGPWDWKILKHFEGDREQWYKIWINYWSSPRQDSLIYYQSLNIGFISILFSVICILVYRLIRFRRETVVFSIKRFGRNK